MPYADRERQLAYMRDYQRKQRLLLKKLKEKQAVENGKEKQT
jgi:hypothetical protein